MTKGYLVLAQGPYAAHAEMLAKSIAQTQSDINNISVITDKKIDKGLFDHVIPISQDLSGNAEWKIHNRVQFYDLTPYDQTVILDADMLFLTDVSHWWPNMAKYELLLTSRVKTYRGDWITESPYRLTFKENKLPDVYSGFAYFQKTSFTKEFFDLCKAIILNWDKFVQQYASFEQQSFPSLDLAMSMAVHILDCKDQVTTHREYPTFTHMKSGCQGWKKYTEDWVDTIPTYISRGRVKIGAHEQTGVLHYVNKDFIKTDVQGMFK